MTARIVQTSESVTLVGAGPVNAGILEDALKRASFLIALDGGAQIVQNYGKTPEFVLGDLDSVDARCLTCFPPDRVIEMPDQDHTDFDKALGAIRAPLILGLGFLGGRADHQMGALNALARHGGTDVVLLGEEDVVFRVPQSIALDLDPGTRVSFYPLNEARIEADGLRWPLEDVVLSTTGLISQSNEAAQGPVNIRTMDAVLAFLPRQALDAVIDALTRSRQIT